LLQDGTLELDANPVENQIRPIALTRKTRSSRAMRAAPKIGSSDVNPVDHIAATLRAILDGHPQSGIDDLMPWRFNQPPSLAA